MHRLRTELYQALPGLNSVLSPRDTMYLGDDAHYVSVGFSALRFIEEALGGTTPRHILDLPCGYGRVTRTLRARFPDAAITACDLDAEAAAFCAEHFGARGTVSVRDFPELDLGEEFDLIWVGSLITHLPPRQTGEFLSAMARHMSDSAVLVVSSHGPSIIPRLRGMGYGLTPADASAVIEEFERTGFGYRDYGGGGAEYGVALTNENYGISLIGEAWFRETLPEHGLRLDAYRARAWDDHHDIIIARHSGVERSPSAAPVAEERVGPTSGLLARIGSWLRRG